MKLYMQNGAFHWGSPVALFDKSGRTRYTLTSDAYSLGKRLHVIDLAGREAIYIYQQIPSLFPRYEIEVYGKPVGEIVKDLTSIRPRYTMESLEWEIMGSVGTCDYEITRHNAAIASSRPHHTSSGDVLVLEVYERAAELTALGIMLTINCIFAAQEPKHL